MVPAIFLDRDGVIIENRTNYVRSWEDVSIFPQAVTALARVRASPYKIVVVTNQSAIGRGILSYAEAQAINQRLLAVLEQSGCRIDGVFLCPHTPEDHCTCRKPQPGLILQAVQALCLDVTKSMMIGDAWSDLQAGLNAGIHQNALVRTGRGQEQAMLTRPAGLDAAPVFDTLSDALEQLLTIRTSRTN